MDASTVELVAALRGWAQQAYRAARHEYGQSPADAPLTEWAGAMTEHLGELSWLLSSRLGAERERLATALATTEEAAARALAELDAAHDEDARALDEGGRGRRRAAVERLNRAEPRYDAAFQALADARAALAAFDAAVGEEAGR